MRPTTTPPFAYRSWMIALLIGLVFVALAYGLRFAIEGAGLAAPHSWLDLSLLLGGYLFLFCLQPIQKAIQRRLCRQTTR
ncbi:hypothetical protein BLL37_05380 [Pseudomonas azotoformans]|uniref:Uncharacterized protein n=1 Tax=Pseudomonas azotoformans TaxID=47878 RepID=A0A1V2JTF7_PSEAZ|nr:hypothetical protein [Pseudomonas azotoformans]OIN52443.1 hypothetical protein BFL39_03960 [Pseudomonas azotoformans]ONH48792.1 hypothetical protein BLL37_05380 [Pseudomonas azotoformans]SDN56710.1 hypothetical protein SAMN04489799_2288 [Pseudomonas azotoformans]